MTTGTFCAPDRRAFVPSEEDVAYYFLMKHARDGERALGTVNSLAGALTADLSARGISGLFLRPYYSQP
jgi:hypothetical protein